MTTALTSSATVRACRERVVVAPMMSAGVIGVVVAPWADRVGWPVFHCLVLLVACAVAGSVDEPSRAIVAATPPPLAHRVLARVTLVAATGAGVLVGGGMLLVDPPYSGSWWALSAEVPVCLAIGLAVGVVWRLRWPDTGQQVAAAGVLLVIVLLINLPGRWVTIDPQPWGPPLEAALWRCLGLGLLCLAIVVRCLRDPARHD